MLGRHVATASVGVTPLFAERVTAPGVVYVSRIRPRRAHKHAGVDAAT